MIYLRTAMLSGEGPDIVETPGPSYVKEYQEAGLINIYARIF
jgi:hypothetical protein